MSETILRLTGPDTRDFLQGLISNDIRRLDDGPVYAAMLTPQGKFLADFLLWAEGDAVCLASAQAATLAKRLAMYRLRAQVEIDETGQSLARGAGTPPPGGQLDPRDPALGWFVAAETPQPHPDWDALRVTHVIPETGAELTPDSYLLEMGFERLHGVDFRKGCYVGQEVTARMKHKTTLKKGLTRVLLDGPADPGTPLLTPEGKEAGTLHTVSGDRALAYLRFDRADGPMQAGATTATRDPNAPAADQPAP